MQKGGIIKPVAEEQKGINQILWMVMLGAACFAGGLLILYILSVFFGSLGFLGV